ncbi:MAG: flagellin lysine-N-methylase [Lachnospiraceae bacterium]|nr:flagellin lysine-N-methylase [Lachnospiraceae bacterium]
MSEITREMPAYYNDYICTGNTTCIDVCCNAWILPMDPDTVKLYQGYPGEDGKFFRDNIMQNEKGEWLIKLHSDGRCPFLTDDDLCGVRLRAGEDAQIKICKVYPRERDVKAGDYRLNCLLLSCSEVGRMFYKGSGDRLEFVRTVEESDEEISPELKERTRILLSFRDGMVNALQDGCFDKSLFEVRESVESIGKILDDAIYFENNGRSEEVFSIIRKILPGSEELFSAFLEDVPDVKKWIRKTAAYFAHRNILDTFQDGSIEGPLYSVFRSVHVLLLICLAIYKDKGSFDVDDMIESAHIFGNLFEISMHNISLLKEIRNRAQDKEYTDGENSELRPFLYP